MLYTDIVKLRYNHFITTSIRRTDKAFVVPPIQKLRHGRQSVQSIDTNESRS